MAEDTTIRSSMLREQLNAANARIAELEARTITPPELGINPASIDFARSWMQRGIGISTFDGAVVVADRLATAVMTLEAELRQLRGMVEQRDQQIDYLKRSRLEAP